MNRVRSPLPRSGESPSKKPTVATNVISAFVCALIIVITGQMTCELDSGRTALLVEGVVARFCLKFMATRSLFSMGVLVHL